MEMEGDPGILHIETRVVIFANKRIIWLRIVLWVLELVLKIVVLLVVVQSIR